MNLKLERVKGIEPSSSDWQPEALPLSYTRGIIFTCFMSKYDLFITKFRERFIFRYYISVLEFKVRNKLTAYIIFTNFTSFNIYVEEILYTRYQARNLEPSSHHLTGWVMCLVRQHCRFYFLSVRRKELTFLTLRLST